MINLICQISQIMKLEEGWKSYHLYQNSQWPQLIIYKAQTLWHWINSRNKNSLLLVLLFPNLPRCISPKEPEPSLRPSLYLLPTLSSPDILGVIMNIHKYCGQQSYCKLFKHFQVFVGALYRSNSLQCISLPVYNVITEHYLQCTNTNR